MRKVVCRMARTDNGSKELPRPLAIDESKLITNTPIEDRNEMRANHVKPLTVVESSCTLFYISSSHKKKTLLNKVI